MKIRPILFQTEMVQAILAGRKTETRRTRGLEDLVIDVDSGYMYNSKGNIQIDIHNWKEEILKYCPYGQVGDVLYVREKFRQYYPYNELSDKNSTKIKTEYAADNPEEIYEKDGDGFGVLNKNGSERTLPWKPSLFMPKEAARLWLKIVDVRVERLQDITEEDAIAEGAKPAKIELAAALFQTTSARRCYRDGFQILWIKINGEESWKANPWVWVVKFEVLSTTGKPENI